ncbi:hypothetical protein J7T55_011989 [Diaporthe amygdali]|uniref:uncharacterized protein n=1 Tax=Phomopsis amygdali TaxID=1214568 RepID=UPI0022FEE6E1|nr:uncharacterized protein J7T55_011989 [Diaporthe amygdali]KAJ0123524.1 hypothetical protein J7T55_011989 [Diaporthe amygdali]
MSSKSSKAMAASAAKVLPPTPSALSPRKTLSVYSPETYAQLLEQENQQLRLKNKQLQLELQSLETKIGAETAYKREGEELADKYSDALKQRDKLVGEIAETIINEFQRYKRAVQQRSDNDEEIKVYSRFDESPI